MAHKISQNWRHPPCFLSSRNQFTAFTLPEITDLVTRVNKRWDDPWSYLKNDVKKSAYYHQSGLDTRTTHWALKLSAWCGTCAGVNLQMSWQDIITWYLIVKVWAFMALCQWFLLHWLPLVCHTHWQGHQVDGGMQKTRLPVPVDKDLPYMEKKILLMQNKDNVKSCLKSLRSPPLKSCLKFCLMFCLKFFALSVLLAVLIEEPHPPLKVPIKRSNCHCPMSSPVQ